MHEVIGKTHYPANRFWFVARFSPEIAKELSTVGNISCAYHLSGIAK
jgi:hypothetical protein